MIVAQVQRSLLAQRRVAAVALPAFIGGYRLLSSGKVIYTGFYADKLRMLKRISFGTCMMAIFGLPALLFSVKEGMTLATQMSIGGMALFASVSSTGFLHYITRPYVVTLKELPQDSNSSDNSTSNAGRLLEAERYTITGKIETTQFNEADVERVTVRTHAFANIRANKNLYYVFEKMCEDQKLLDTLAKAPVKK